MAQRLKTDWSLFVTVVAMVFFGLVILFSASSVTAEVRYQNSGFFLLRQLGWAVGAFAALMLLKRFDYRRLNNPRLAFIAMGMVIVLLIAVLAIDTRHHRWIRIGGVGIQPSEFAKPALILFLAFFISHRSKAINSRYTLLPAVVSLLLMSGLVVVADLGTALVLVATAAAVFYVAGLEHRYFFAAALIGVLCIAGAVVAKPYRLGRIIAYVDPDYTILDKIDPKGYIKNYVHSGMSTRDPGYQARQAKIAVGSGGVLGLGLMQGRQKLFYLPEAHTDFIYAVVGEELGLWGCGAVLAGFLVILYRGLRLYWLAADDFGRYLALGVAASIVLQAMINMSVVLDLGPTKGIPLPMISHGGSSLLSTLTSLGMLLSVSERS